MTYIARLETAPDVRVPDGLPAAPEVQATSVDLPRGDSILVPGRTCWCVSPVTGAGLLIDGRDYYRAFHQAASQAKKFILMAGWQFDSDLPLLRGEDRPEAGRSIRLLPFLRDLCRKTPELQIRLLCWDYNPAYFFQREWFQDLRFNWSTPSNLRFRFDDRHAVGASHHQKFVVVDGALALAGSMDLCNDRWDARHHPALCSHRLEPHGEDHYGPYHEVQGCVMGPAVLDLVDLFGARWRSSGGEELNLPDSAPQWNHPVRVSIRIDAKEVGLSRTVAQTLTPEQPSVREIRQLYLDAIGSAETSIYLENQYFGSSAVYEALMRRMIDKTRPRLNIVLVHPARMKSVPEELSMASKQKRMFRHLKRTADRMGHALGIYYSSSRHADGREACRYIHSKLMIVDDRFMTLGSANINNRSMGLDTELNLSWEATPEDPQVWASIRKARVSLIAEHAGVTKYRDFRRLYDGHALVQTLDEWTRTKPSGLHVHPMLEKPEDHAGGVILSRESLEFDPEGPAFEENLFESLKPGRRELWRHGVGRVRRRLTRLRRLPWRMVVDTPASLSRRPHRAWAGLSRALRRLSIPTAGLALGTVLIWVFVRLCVFVLSGLH